MTQHQIIENIPAIQEEMFLTMFLQILSLKLEQSYMWQILIKSYENLYR